MQFKNDNDKVNFKLAAIPVAGGWWWQTRGTLVQPIQAITTL